MKTLSIAQSVCIEYDEIMLHHRKTFSASHFGDTTDEDGESQEGSTAWFHAHQPDPVLF